MSISRQLQSYLREHNIKHSLVTHPRTGSSMETAEQAHVPGDALAKGILVRTQDGEYRMVVVPSDYHIELGTLGNLLGVPVELASEEDLGLAFPDCERGAVPPIGDAYGIPTLWDPEASLGAQEHVYFESGDHEHLVSVSGRYFHELMAHAERAHLSHHI